MALPPNQASGSGTTVKAKAPKKPSATKPAAGRYDWGKGGAVHSISKAAHQQHVAARPAPVSQDLTTPPTLNQATTEANAAANLQYGPAVQAAQQQLANNPVWFQEHMARVAGYAQAAQAQAAPILGQAQAFQDATGSQMAPGLDPNSDAGRAAAMAAQGRQALAALGSQALQTNAQSTQDVFGGMQAVASRQLPQAQAAAQTQLTNAQSQRGAAVTKYLGDARANAQNYQIARGTLNLNTDKANADAAIASGKDPVTGAPLPTKPATTKSSGAFAGLTDAEISALSPKARQDKIDAYNKSKGSTTAGPGAKYGYTNDQWSRFSATHRQRIIRNFNANTPASDKAAQKHADAITTASGGVANTITDIIGKYKSYIGKETDDTSKPIMKDGRPVKGPDGKPTYKGRKLTDAEIRAILGQNKSYTPQLIHIAVLRSQGKPLDQASIDYLHNYNKDIRIPRDWLPKPRLSDTNTKAYGKAPPQPQGHS